MAERSVPTVRMVPGILAIALVWAGAVQAHNTSDVKSDHRQQAATQRGGEAPSIEALEQALDKARAEAPLTIEPFLLVTEGAKYYGGYTPRPNNVLQSAEPLQFYMEPKNLVRTRAADGTYSLGFDVDLEVLMTTGEVIATQEKFGSFRITSQSRLQDIFMNLKVTLTGAPAGEYQIRFTVKDANSEKIAAVSHPVVVK